METVSTKWQNGGLTPFTQRMAQLDSWIIIRNRKMIKKKRGCGQVLMDGLFQLTHNYTWATAILFFTCKEIDFTFFFHYRCPTLTHSVSLVLLITNFTSVITPLFEQACVSLDSIVQTSQLCQLLLWLKMKSFWTPLYPLLHQSSFQHPSPSLEIGATSSSLLVFLIKSWSHDYNFSACISNCRSAHKTCLNVNQAPQISETLIMHN